MTYYINGWRESKGYFCRFGWTEEEMQRMYDGEVIERNGNKYWIEQ